MCIRDRYAYEEQYTDKLITERIRNLRQPKVIIKTFTNIEIKKMIDYYNGYDFLTLRNKTILCMLFDTGMRLNEILTLPIIMDSLSGREIEKSNIEDMIEILKTV